MFQNWHDKFDEFWPNHLKVSKNFHLMCPFWEKYIIFELKTYRGVIFHDTEKGYKIWKGIDLPFLNWHKEFHKFWPEHAKVSKILTLMDFFWIKYILLELKKYRGFLSWQWRVMQNLKKNWHAVWKMTWGIWQIFTRTLESVTIVTLMGIF